MKTKISESNTGLLCAAHEATLALSAHAENLYLLREFLSIFLKTFIKKPIPNKTLYNTKLALQEACSNVIRHAFPQGSNEQFQVTFRCGEEEISMEIVDSGIPFNLETAETTSAHGLSEGGYGLRIIKKTMDSIEYRREMDRNILTLRKFI